MTEFGELSNSMVEPPGLLFFEDGEEVSLEPSVTDDASDFAGLTSSARVCLEAILSL